MNTKKIVIIVVSAVLAALIVAAGIILIFMNFNAETETASYNSEVVSVSSDSSSEEESVSGGVLEISSHTASVGDTVSVTVDFKENPGIWGIQLILDYDSSALEYVSYTEGELFPDYEVHPTEGQIRALALPKDLNNATESGTVVKYNFKVKNGTKAGDYEIKVNGTTSICNADEVTVSPKIVNGKITVK